MSQAQFKRCNIVSIDDSVSCLLSSQGGLLVSAVVDIARIVAPRENCATKKRWPVEGQRFFRTAHTARGLSHKIFVGVLGDQHKVWDRVCWQAAVQRDSKQVRLWNESFISNNARVIHPAGRKSRRG